VKVRAKASDKTKFVGRSVIDRDATFAPGVEVSLPDDMKVTVNRYEHHINAEITACTQLSKSAMSTCLLPLPSPTQTPTRRRH